MNRILAQNARQPCADLSAGRQNHLIVFVITSLGVHHPDQILSTDEAARLAAGYPQVPHGQVLAMLSRSCVLVKHEGAEAIPVKI
jgi:hypothetical protein